MCRYLQSIITNGAQTAHIYMIPFQPGAYVNQRLRLNYDVMDLAVVKAGCCIPKFKMMPQQPEPVRPKPLQ